MPVRDEALRDFGRKLQALMLKRGWNQSELARRADTGRDNISRYIRGKTAPEAPQLAALAKALSVAPDDLLPGIVLSESLVERAAELKQLGSDKAFIRVGQVTTMKKALKILQILSED
jgi:transcriptional regulator with XRE-family HTH domain